MAGVYASAHPKLIKKFQAVLYLADKTGQIRSKRAYSKAHNEPSRSSLAHAIQKIDYWKLFYWASRNFALPQQI